MTDEDILKIKEVVESEYKKKYGTNYSDYSLESAQNGAIMFAKWLDEQQSFFIKIKRDGK